MKKILFITLLINSFILVGAVDYGKYFSDKTMRLDYFHTGNSKTEHFAVDRILNDGNWPGSRTVLIDDLNLGLYQFEVRDAAENKLIYSRGFASIFGEWQTIPEAKKEWGTFHESIRFPWPKRAVKVVMKKRDKQNNFKAIWKYRVDPAERKVNKGEIEHTNRSYAIKKSGDPAKKVDIVFLGDGYTKAEMGKFKKDVERLANVMLDSEPFEAHKGDFNIWAVETPSVTSGVCKPHPGVFKRTPLSVHYSSFDSERYALSYDNRTIRDAASAVPYEFMVILVNEKTYGGAGIYRLYGTLAADNKLSDYIMVHEMGHHMAGLADEYYSSSVSYEIDSNVKVEPWEMNITALLDKSKLKWGHLIEKKTPLPTPWGKKQFDTFAQKIKKKRAELRAAKVEESVVEELFFNQRKTEQGMFKKMKYYGKTGAFEGAGYLSKGLYRSSVDCIMFTRSQKFCPVCCDALTKVINQYNK